jgi:hypothetical protein
VLEDDFDTAARVEGQRPDALRRRSGAARDEKAGLLLRGAEVQNPSETLPLVEELDDAVDGRRGLAVGDTGEEVGSLAVPLVGDGVDRKPLFRGEFAPYSKGYRGSGRALAAITELDVRSPSTQVENLMETRFESCGREPAGAVEEG